MANIRKLILENALKWENKKEKSGNSGFEDPELQRRMEEAGWDLGQAWCSYAAEVVWVDAYKEAESDKVDRIEQLFDPSATATFRNYLKSPEFTVNKYPDFGCLIVWRKYVKNKEDALVPSWMGHIGVVIDPVLPPNSIRNYVDNETNYEVVTIEGNTNIYGGREGIQWGRMNRKVEYRKKQGLNLLGFVHPIEV